MAEKADQEATGTQRPSSITPPPTCCRKTLMNWKRLVKTCATFAATNIVFWFVSFSPFRVVCLLCLCLLLLLLVQLLRDIALSRSKGSNLWRSMTGRYVNLKVTCIAVFVSSMLPFQFFLSIFDLCN
ncbi:hypothetical protein KOW79_006138 [Hemibagrus wyckioides]|uniref:RETREG1-3/ARL6IP-like N-terminal reticulon-homology domain-containing protein n=1 Tax=Hemibagrus wyckioides TaxID=337641 RepID=A0A9D3SM79_9TELE|nr:hypothetical protein KOW79_006138 [Hemibagrus wyckioides]